MNQIENNSKTRINNQPKEDNPRNKGRFFKIQWVYALAAIILGGYLVFQTVRSIQITKQKLDIFELAKDEVQDLRLKNIDLILMSERVISEKYIESAARDRLNYAKNGEILFIVPSELLEDEKLSEYVESFNPYYVPDEKYVDVFAEWEDFFRYGI